MCSWKVIILERENKVREAISLEKASHTQKYVRMNTSYVEVSVDWEKVANEIKRTEEWFQEVQSASEGYLYATLEEFTNPSRLHTFCQKIMSYLGITRADMRKCIDAYERASEIFPKQDSGKLCETVKNFREGEIALQAARASEEAMQSYQQVSKECR